MATFKLVLLFQMTLTVTEPVATCATGLRERLSSLTDLMEALDELRELCTRGSLEDPENVCQS